MLKTVMVAVVLAVAALGMTQVDVRPAGAVTLGPVPSPALAKAGSTVELVGRRGGRFHRGRRYYRSYGHYRYRHGHGYRHGYHRGYGYGYAYPRYGYRYPYYGFPWWGYGGAALDLGFGTSYYGGGYYGIDGYDGYGDGYRVSSSSDHVRWCRNRYRSYNRRTDTFRGYDGRRHRCRGPY